MSTPPATPPFTCLMCAQHRQPSFVPVSPANTLTTGRFNPNKNAVPLDRADLVKSLVDQDPPVQQEGARSPLIVQLSPHMTPAKQTVSAK
jgi:hypothetical protein